MPNLKGTVLLTVPTFHNSKLHVLTPHRSSIQYEEQPVLITQLPHTFGYYLHDGDVVNFSLRSIICACFPKA